jgi:hypothetical protein
MRGELEWNERADEGKRRVRVTVFGGKIKWQFQEPGAERWDYDRRPTPADWDTLLAQLERKHQRNRTTLRDLELVRRLRAEAAGRGE